MDAAAPPPADPPAKPPPSPAEAERRAELILEAVKRAITEPGEHRLFRAGKLAGLFPSRAGPSAEAALAALTDGVLETVRTEAKGKLIVEWVRATPRAVGYVHDRDSTKAALRELRDVLTATRDGVPAWLDDARREVAAVGERFERRAAEFLQRLDALAGRVDAALRRADVTGPQLADPLARLVPWAADALEYLDRRPGAGAAGDCPLAELFDALRGRHPGLTVPDFHDGLRRLHDNRAVRLTAAGAVADPEYAMIVGAEMCSHVGR